MKIANISVRQVDVPHPHPRLAMVLILFLVLGVLTIIGPCPAVTTSEIGSWL